MKISELLEPLLNIKETEGDVEVLFRAEGAPGHVAEFEGLSVDQSTVVGPAKVRYAVVNLE